MRREASIAHVDLDAMFAAVEQRDKVSLRGRPVIVGGVAGRGVVATASYEARRFGARSAMPTAEARRRCPPGTAFLAPRFPAYRRTSEVVMAVLAEVSPLVEQVSIDEAYVDLAAADRHDLSVPGVTRLAEQVRAAIAAATGGVTASIGVGTSKLIAKIGSDLHKPDGLTVAAPGTEQALLHPLPVTRLPGVGPATADRLRRAGLHTIGELTRTPLPELIDWFGQAHGAGLYRLARADDDRAVVGEREAKSVSAEETFDVDLTDRTRLNTEIDLLATRVGGRLRTGGLSARTITIKIRHYDFTTITRSTTRAQPTDDPRLVAQIARRLLADIDTSGGIRLLGVGVTTLAGFVQDDLFGSSADDLFGSLTPDHVDSASHDHVGSPTHDHVDSASHGHVGSPIHHHVDSAAHRSSSSTHDHVGSPVGDRPDPAGADRPASGVGAPASGVGTPASGVGTPANGVGAPANSVGAPANGVGAAAAFAVSGWRPGQDVRHDTHGAGWVWGSGRGVVTVRFEGPATPPGPVLTFAADDPALHPADPPDWTVALPA
ncbi:DNA polymerase IV [Actinoplanes sp. NBRC 103695]|uniref:DNA polymerase IV n=1 Tax=Actinoplanes sp. NBRC 103695 TaxID=3032202 RepID=UPI002553C821|nr:DNA polymerase IV [Actinoplanes sp. NBRC 103695]